MEVNKIDSMDGLEADGNVTGKMRKRVVGTLRLKEKMLRDFLNALKTIEIQ